MQNIHFHYLAKGEDEETYKRFALEGSDLMHPVRIKGQSHRPDINIPYHATIKLFDTSKDTPEQAHEVASKLALNPPDPKQVQIEPVTLKGRTGYTIHAIKLHGPHAEQMKEHHSKFSHMGYPENYNYHPHISVDRETWNNIVNSKAKTAHEAGIEFMPAELHHKTRVVASYKPKVAQNFGQEKSEEDKLNASEQLGIVRDVIGMSVDLQKHYKAALLNDKFLQNYLNDNPGLLEQAMQKHQERVKYHFGDNAELIELAKNKGLKAAYEAKSRK